MGKEVFDYEKFAIDIKKKRHEMEGQHFTRFGVRELGTQIGTSSATIHRIMQGKKPDLETAIRICKWLSKKLDHYVLN